MDNKFYIKKVSILIFTISLLISSIGCTSLPIINETDAHFEESSSSNTNIFIDSAGRKNELPKNIETVVPSGRVAQMMISMIAPEKLVSLADLPKYIQKDIPRDLPITGQLYGGKGQINYEEIINKNPDIIIDIGEMKKTIKEDLDEVQKTTNKPTIFIKADLENTAKAFRVLGELLGEEERAERLAKFTEEAISFAEEGKKDIKEKKKVYQTTSDDGLGADLDGTAHTEILNLIGAENAAETEAQGGKPGQTVYMEQILEWNPDIVIANNRGLGDIVMNDERWKNVKAVQDDAVYTVPQDPFSWVSKPPSANRIIGIYWMAKTIYPEVYDIDLKMKTKEWYKLAYNYELTDEEYEVILNGDFIQQ
ncbi:MAG: ABC transporter substrate-binding protein [Andreesenia angusta]|nr:ABC transporter substrate-binding protein [Andreesenia angusta]